MKTKIVLSFFVIIIVVIGCGPQGASKYKLTENEKRLCDSLQIDPTIIQDIRQYNQSEMESFHYSLGKIFQYGETFEIDPIRLQGLVFTEQNAKSYDLVFKLKDQLKKKGYSIFLLENNFDINDEPDYIGVLKTTDKYEVLKQIGTDGINYDITNDSLISIIHQFDKECSLELVGASGDWCEFIIHKAPSDWMKFAEEAYDVCPDIVDQGVGTIEALATEMRRSKRLYFWWD